MAVPDGRVDEFEMTRWEWTDVHSLASLWSLRSEHARMIWTPVEELDACVLTLLAPAGRMFWDFSENFQACLAGQARYTQALSARPDATTHLDALCRELGADRASFLSHVVFGGLTRPFGERYFAADLGAEVFLLAQRHASIAVPQMCQQAVSRYFRRQSEVFAEDSFRACDEAATAAGGDESDAARAALGIAVEALSAGARMEAIDWLNRAMTQTDATHAIGLVHACRGANLALYRAPGASDLGAIEALLRLRARAVIEHGTLAAVETMKAALATPGWNQLAVADLREALLGMLDARLCAYPVIQTDPFASWGHPH